MQGDDCFYLHGMKDLVSDVFKTLWNKNVVILRDLSEDNIRKADIIILNFLQGEVGTCVPELRFRQKGVVIGMLENGSHDMGRKTSCYRDIFYIPLSSSVTDIRSHIINIWTGYKVAQKKYSADCMGCRHKVMSRQQTRIMAGLYRGKKTSEIARELGISDKTVHAHKHLIMNYFNLKGSKDLFFFLQSLAIKDVTPNYFKECLDAQRLL